MRNRIKSFWLNIGALDRDIDLSGRRQIMRAVNELGVEVRATFNYLNKKENVVGLSKVWLFRIGRFGPIGSILLMLKQQLLIMRNLDVNVVVLRAFKVHESLPLFFIYRKILRKKYPKYVLDIRTVPVDLPKGIKGKLLQYKYESAIRLALHYFDGITVISEKLKQDIVNGYNTYGMKIGVWSTGVDVNLFDPNTVKGRRDKLGIEDRFVIMYHGVFSRNRGLQDAIQAISYLKEEFPEILFLLLGKGEGKVEFEQLVENLNLKDNVLIHDPVGFNEVPSFVKTADVGILPFPNLDWWNTSGPLKLGEYLSMGKPVIITDIAAHRAVIGDAECGIYAKDNSPNSLASCMRSAIVRKSELPALGSIGREIAVNNLSWGKQAEKIKDYFELLNN